MDNESLSIHLNLVNIGCEIRKASLIIDTICIWINLGDFQGIFFVVFSGVDDNRLYKTIKSQNLLFCKEWGKGGGSAGGDGVLNLSFERSRGEGSYQD